MTVIAKGLFYLLQERMDLLRGIRFGPDHSLSTVRWQVGHLTLVQGMAGKVRKPVVNEVL